MYWCVLCYMFVLVCSIGHVCTGVFYGTCFYWCVLKDMLVLICSKGHDCTQSGVWYGVWDMLVLVCSMGHACNGVFYNFLLHFFTPKLTFFICSIHWPIRVRVIQTVPVWCENNQMLNVPPGQIWTAKIEQFCQICNTHQ